MEEGVKFKRLRYVKLYLYSSIFIGFLLILGAGASTFGYKKFAPGFEFASLLSGMIGIQISSALLLMAQDFEGKQFKEQINFRRNFIIGLVLSLIIGALLIWIFIVPQ